MKYYIGPLVFLALAAFAVPAQSELIDWKLAEFQPNVPFGGRADTIAVNPSDNHIIFVASESGGLFKTTDGGRSWSHVDTLGAYYTSAVAYVTSDILLATTTDRFSTGMTVAAFGAVPMAALTGRTSPIQLRRVQGAALMQAKFPLHRTPGYFCCDELGCAESSDQGASWIVRGPMATLRQARCRPNPVML